MNQDDSVFECAGAIFDLDGTLLDTEPLYQVAYDRVLAPFGGRLSHELQAEISGRPPLIAVTHVLERLGIALSPEEFLERRRPILHELLAQAAPIRGAPELVAEYARRGIPIAIATSSPRALFEHKVARHAFLAPVTTVVCSDDPEVKAQKPAPDIFLVAARRLGVPIADCIVFEDSPSGLTAARESGARVFAVTCADGLSRAG